MSSRADGWEVFALGLGLFALACILRCTAGCAAWTAKDTQVAVDVGGEILCAIEHVELDDPALDALCAAKGLAPEAGPAELSPKAKKAVAATRAKVAKATAARTVCRSTAGDADAGKP